MNDKIFTKTPSSSFSVFQKVNSPLPRVSIVKKSNTNQRSSYSHSIDLREMLKFDNPTHSSSHCLKKKKLRVRIRGVKSNSVNRRSLKFLQKIGVKKNNEYSHSLVFLNKTFYFLIESKNFAFFNLFILNEQFT